MKVPQYIKRLHSLVLAVLAILCSISGAYAQILTEDTAILRAGDMISIELSGEESFSQPFQINQDGFITLPEIGRIYVGGHSEARALGIITSELSKVFRDIDRLSLMIKERRLLVNVLGYVKNPGPVDLLGNATIQMAIEQAGGLRQGAQLDKVQVRRIHKDVDIDVDADGKESEREEIIVFDYKRYLDNGDPDLLPTLQPLDVVFVPASPLTGNVQVDFDARTLTAAGDASDDGQGVTVFGEVHRPGTFKYKENASLVDFLMRAGGVTRYAGVEQIRVISKGIPFPFNLREFLDTGDQDLIPTIGAGDTIFIPQATDQIKTGARTVYIMGEVFKPGAYETKEDASFFDILANAGGPTRFAETRAIRILRSDGSVTPFDLFGYTEGTNKEELPDIKPGDAIFMPEKTDMNEKSWLKVTPDRAVMIIGAVNRPGRYEWSDEMNLLELLAHAGGPSSKADTSRIKIMPRLGENHVVPVYFDFGSFMDEGGDISLIPEVKAGYTIVLEELPQDPNDNRSQWVRQETDRSIFIMGSVIAPGRYAFNENLSFLDILAQAQGPRPDADLQNIRITHRKGHGGKTHVTKLNLALYFETGDESMLPNVVTTDVIYIPNQNRNWLDETKEQTVRVLGSVAAPGRYAFNDSMTILDLLAAAGGPRSDAWEEKILVVHMVEGKPNAVSFDLLEFAKSGDFTTLPVVREGDTIYLPHISQSHRYKFRENLSDAMLIVSLISTIARGGI